MVVGVSRTASPDGVCILTITKNGNVLMLVRHTCTQLFDNFNSINSQLMCDIDVGSECHMTHTLQNVQYYIKFVAYCFFEILANVCSLNRRVGDASLSWFMIGSARRQCVILVYSSVHVVSCQYNLYNYLEAFS